MKKILVVCLLVIAQFAWASPATDLTQLLNGITTMQSSFKQTVFDTHGKPVKVSYGKMALHRPGKFRWEVKKPIPQLIVANGKRLWIYDPDLEQVTIRHMQQVGGDTPALLLSHVGNIIEQDYDVTEKTDAGDLAWYQLLPKNKNSMFSTIQMGFAGKKITEMKLHDHLGHVTAIKFEHAKTNGKLPANLFVFKAPKGVDVIDETRNRR